LPDIAALPARAFRITIIVIESRLHPAAICRTFDQGKSFDLSSSAI
jgi:hypothetical protein